MEYEIPSDAEVIDAIVKVLKRRGTVESQAELRKLVMVHLLRINRNYRVSGRRMRILAISSGKVSLEIHYRSTGKDVENMEICPVCGSKMRKIENLTLDGGRVTIGFRCTRCPYWTGKRLRMPIRYVFHLR